MPEPADIPEAPALLPQRADGLAAQRGLAVPEGTGISLQHTANQQKKGKEKGIKTTQLQKINRGGKGDRTGLKNGMGKGQRLKKWHGESRKVKKWDGKSTYVKKNGWEKDTS